MTPVQVSIPADPARIESSLKRYGATQGALAMRPGEDLLSASDRWFEHAKRVLATDGYHHTLVRLMTQDGDAQLHFLEFADHPGLYVLIRQIADEVERIGAVGLIYIAEFWAARLEDLKPGQRPSEVPTRQEFLRVIAVTADGRTRDHTIEFRKDEQGEIRFGESSVSGEAAGSDFLEPVRRIWRRWAEQKTARPQP